MLNIPDDLFTWPPTEPEQTAPPPPKQEQKQRPRSSGPPRVGRVEIEQVPRAAAPDRHRASEDLVLVSTGQKQARSRTVVDPGLVLAVIAGIVCGILIGVALPW